MHNYQEALAIAANVPEEERPRVMLNTPFNDVWVLPATQSVTASLIRDAGAIPETGEKEAGDVSHIGMEEALEKLSKADYWIGLGMATSYKELPEVLRTHAKEIRPINWIISTIIMRLSLRLVVQPIIKRGLFVPT